MFGRKLKMIEGLLNLSMYDLMKLYLFFLASAIFGAFFMKYFFINNKNMFEAELASYDILSQNILKSYEKSIKNIGDVTTEIQNETSKNFERINLNLKSLSSILREFNEHMSKVDELEKEIIKYKKILKRKEK